ncbi:transposase protein [Holotrichia oblita]|uniref:Transposase protein n=1 Tax=Holotrichia oblita TaxID=644536 RepID=A0ACB9SV50_HOLOL|nr:transposase protein [Holotrichia oblita]
MTDRDRHYILMFDEMSIQPHVKLNVAVREFEGFADNGFGVIDTGIADHVLVFIIRGITRRWKQPIFFSFSHGPSSSQKLKSLITEVIRRCIAAGLNVMATICDQGAPNVSAINSLASPTDPNRKIFFVDGHKIIHLYDPPHLLKGIRNNLLKSNLVWIKGERRLVAMWEDIYNAYKIDNGSGQLRAMPKLTEGHVNPYKLRKMKVSCASQVFSHNVASVMALMARVELTGLDGTKMRSNASDTAETLQFFDELFDSVNGHMQFWQDAKYHLRNMYFQRPGAQENIRPPSLKNWVISLNGLEEVFKAVQCKGVRYIRPRDFNQDPVEHFFGQIRQQGVRDTNPTASMFTYHFRTALVNGMATQHSLSANCEEDDSYNILNGLRDFVSQETSANVIVREDVNISLPSEELTTYVDKLSIGYVSGFIAKNIRKLSKCELCKSNIFCKDTVAEWHDLIIEKEFADNIPLKMKYCTPSFMKFMCQIYNVTRNQLPVIICKKQCLNILISLIKNHIFLPFDDTCGHKREVVDFTVDYFIKFLCHNWCTGVNRILKGADDRLFTNDVIYKQARHYYLKMKRSQSSLIVT